jgi:hypothetical protein
MTEIETFDKIMDNDKWFTTFKSNLDQNFEDVKLIRTENGFHLTIDDISHKIHNFNQALIKILHCFDGNFKLGKTRFFEGVLELEGIL